MYARIVQKGAFPRPVTLAERSEISRLVFRRSWWERFFMRFCPRLRTKSHALFFGEIYAISMSDAKALRSAVADTPKRQALCRRRPKRRRTRLSISVNEVSRLCS